MSRSPSSLRVRSARYSPTSRPRTRSTSPRHALGEAGELELSLDDAQDTQLSTPQSTTSEPPTCTSTTLAQSAHHDPCSEELSGVSPHLQFLLLDFWAHRAVKLCKHVRIQRHGTAAPKYLSSRL
ncbi:hypothetical protein F441_04226 [Phytophthora nicotianae CJ01A1]|uniref:Uncharacterized protein n=1 Tax=Phytophthora nicotianae CJ01A1 TaxID=1317063 RepID=W2XIA2_PHYNI|nr:hypothetical protein F441_04226 [Phytophthora nicotianae CJ01A1]